MGVLAVKVFRAEVESEIRHFNENRGRRKALNPTIVDYGLISRPYKKYGRMVDVADAVKARDCIAKATVRTMLKKKPRPRFAALDIYEHKENKKMLFRLITGH